MDAHIHSGVPLLPPGVRPEESREFSAQLGRFAGLLLEDMNRAAVDKAVVSLGPSPTEDWASAEQLRDARRAVETWWGELAAVCPKVVPLVSEFDPGTKEGVDYAIRQLETGRFGGVGSWNPSRKGPPAWAVSPHFERLIGHLADFGGVFVYHNHGVPESLMLDLVRRYPRQNFLCFGCPQEDKEQFALTNIFHTVLLSYHDSRTPPSREFFDRLATRRVVLATDMTPSGFDPNMEPTDTACGTVVECNLLTREFLAQADPAVAASIAWKGAAQLLPGAAKSIAGPAASGP